MTTKKLYKINGFLAYYLIGTLFFFSCNNNLPPPRDTWVIRNCCDNSPSRLHIENFTLLNNQKISITFCELKSPSNPLLLSLTFKKKKSKPKKIFEIVSENLSNQEIIISILDSQNRFRGDFFETETFQEGFYRLYISTGNICGEITFRIKNSKIIGEKFICIMKC